jgi:hypothetical protein
VADFLPGHFGFRLFNPQVLGYIPSFANWGATHCKDAMGIDEQLNHSISRESFSS